MSKKLDSILEKVKKSYNIEIVDPDKDQGSRITLDSPGLNFALGGSWVNGRMYYLQGPESGGKSTIATYIASQIQKKYTGHNTILYIDFEYSADLDHMQELGLDVHNNFILMRPLNGEDAFESIKELVETDEVGLVVIDSITSMSSKAQNESMFKATFGGGAALLSNGLRSINPYLYRHNCSLIMISQERSNVGVMYGPEFKGTGGYSPRYYSSWMARITRTEDITDKDKGLIGIKIRCRNTKNKLGIPKRDANLVLYFNGGIDSEDEYLDYLKTLGIIEQRGSYFSNEEWGMKVQGKNGVAEFLHSNPELYEKVKQQVNDMICGHTNLDNQELSEEEAWAEYENFNPETGEIEEYSPSSGV